MKKVFKYNPIGRLSKAIALAEAFKRRFEKAPVCAIATTELKLQQAIGVDGQYNARRDVSKILDNLLKLHVLKCESNFYSQSESQAKQYSFNLTIYKSIKSFYLSHVNQSVISQSS